jgi:hypothetical protein
MFWLRPVYSFEVKLTEFYRTPLLSVLHVSSKPFYGLMRLSLLFALSEPLGSLERQVFSAASPVGKSMLCLMESQARGPCNCMYCMGSEELFLAHFVLILYSTYDAQTLFLR